MMSPKVTVITGYYNRVSLIKDTVESILSQTFTNFEFLIFDDCSTDGTREELIKIAKKDVRIKLLLHDENIGLTQGLINAVLESKGEYIAIHGAGDVSFESRLEKQVKVLDSNPDYVIVSSFFTNLDQNTQRKQHVKNDKLIFETSDLLKGSPISHGGVLYRKETYFNAGQYRSIFKFSQDKDLWLRMSKFGKIYMIPEYLYERVIELSTQVSFKPAKFISQYKYSYLSKFIFSKTQEEQSYLFDKIKRFGIDSVIDNSILPQGQIFKRFLILFAKESIPDEDIQIFLKYSNSKYNIVYRIFTYFYGIKPIRKLVNLIYHKVLYSN